MRRVVVTGLGVVSPVGNSVEDAWYSIVNGQSGIDVVAGWRDGRWASDSLQVHIGGEVKNFNPEEWVVPKKDVRRMDRFIHLAIAAAHEAWAQAGLPARLTDEEGDRAGTIIGVGMIGMPFFLNTYETLLEKGPNRVTPFFIPATIANLAPGHVAIRYNLRSTSFATVSACASGAHGIGEAFMHIRDGRSDLMVTGGAEGAMHPLAVSGFQAMHALCASGNDDPKSASKPFDKNRDGFVMGEGAGILVLEELEHAKNRGANILAELVGYGSSSDAHHITAPAPGGEGAQRAMKQALAMGKLHPSDIGYINAHGTSTGFNDKAETQAIKSVFGSHSQKVMVSSTKSMTGHLLGAAGGVEAVFSVLALTKGILPPTINYNTPDPECDLDYIPNTSREVKVSAVMSNSFGFGGANAVLVMQRYCS